MIDIFAATGRSAGDLLSRVVRITLGGQTYELPVRSMAANREWKTALSDRLGGFLATVNETDDTAKLLALVATQADDLLDMIVSYDAHGILPTREVLEAIEPDISVDLVQACREVWRAANPLVVTALADLAADKTLAPEANASSPPTSTSPRRTATAPRKRSRST